MDKIEVANHDALVIGSGLAGLRAAEELARAGLRTLLVSSGPFRSGSSFCPWTWGLGMVAPRNDAERQALFDEIGAVGLGLNEGALTRTLVERVAGEIERLQSIGVEFRPATEAAGVIPCFGSFRLAWYGFEFPSARRAFGRLADLENLDIEGGLTVVDLFDAGLGDKAALCYRTDGAPKIIRARAIVIATGGFTPLFSRNFSAETAPVPLHAAAAKLGCRMRNMEFVQFIPAHTAPAARSIFNERAFSRVRFEAADGAAIFGDADRPLLEMRAAHGPFTTRLPDIAIDEAMFSRWRDTGQPVSAVYPPDIDAEPDTLLRAYFHWFRGKFKGEIPSRIGILHYAHACNGGIEIDAGGRTAVPGIFACGETSGGIHGADRIGGLSTGGALVFGAAAGRSAAAYCRDGAAPERSIAAAEAETRARDLEARAGAAQVAASTSEPDADPNLAAFRETVYRHASIMRDAAGMDALDRAADTLAAGARAEGYGGSASGSPATSAERIARAEAMAGTLRLFVAAMRARPERAGCHNFRTGK